MELKIEPRRLILPSLSNTTTSPFCGWQMTLVTGSSWMAGAVEKSTESQSVEGEKLL